MRALIIEDEKPAAQQLIRILNKSEKFEGDIEGPLQSIEDTVAHLKREKDYDLIFMDIHLLDGPSFEIFKQVEPPAPIIFCTAYDQYALEAFKLNSVDYLLKPIDPEDLDRALGKFLKWHKQAQGERLSADAILKMLSGKDESPQFKERFIIKLGDRILSLATDDLGYFYSAEKATFTTTKDGKDYPLEYSLDQLESFLNPKKYFRINRKYLISLESIIEMRSYSGSRIKLQLQHSDDQDILVSRDKTSDFKLWLDA